MNFPEWLDGERGRPTLVAMHFDISISAVTQWRTNGIPVARMLAVHELTGGDVSLQEMVAHIKPPSIPSPAESSKATA